MKLFCECTAKWHRPGGKHGQVETNQQCPYCNFYLWYDAYHENMLVDLKEMNKC